MRIGLYQDRPEHFVAIQLAILSMRDFHPDWQVDVYLAHPDAAFEAWLARFDHLSVRTAPPYRNGFNAKPAILLDMLDRHGGEVMWVDSDIILTRSLAATLAAAPPDHVVLAEDPPGLWPAGTEPRTRGWGFPVGRSLATSVNSCIVRVNATHRPLVAAWADALVSGAYSQAQADHWSRRPFYYLGDQDALAALVGSADFAHVPVSFLKSGTDIAQCYFANGYAWQDRLLNLARGTPPLVHAQGEKPWAPPQPVPLYLDVCPYKFHARRYRAELLHTQWLEIQTQAGAVLSAMALGHPDLSGLFPALLESLRHAVRRLRKRNAQLGTGTVA